MPSTALADIAALLTAASGLGSFSWPGPPRADGGGELLEHLGAQERLQRRAVAGGEGVDHDGEGVARALEESLLVEAGIGRLGRLGARSL